MPDTGKDFPCDEGEWITLTAERALYVQPGRTFVLCDRLPSPVTLVLKIGGESLRAKAAVAPSQREDTQ